ncbi:hypothetical protein PTSG_12385 [Salpingoeca rosetta]|uniref:Uncharacterized protein n=1 Tax=Salpingoeca rosetta (strain ATCC 50818 / BSB-021) TaxID=946362 RepID=F2UDI6_SALR5|nr:uncharacterized protein PTSG_12385 [Salpingoeca rosetta]EGD74681.1 hypothetical protein PTSG_12385 [Salpingoeca rosetta]|eukprot:XP_004992938.1 hypothetical protein PTSG_12385 [Salpingoeca rosetta]
MTACEAEDGCQWDAAGCFLAQHPCFQYQDKRRCNGRDECQWQEMCLRSVIEHEFDDYGSTYCERMVCRDALSKCTGGCRATYECALRPSQQGECTDPDVCLNECMDQVSRTAEEHAAFMEVAKCEKRCYFAPVCAVSNEEMCQANHLCSRNQYCAPKDDTLCWAETKLACLSDRRCSWDEDNYWCYLQRHECLSYQDATLCRASSSSCEWRKECEYDEPVPPEDPTKVCMEERCASVIKPCTERADCRAAWEFIGARYENGTCDAACFNDAYADLSVGAARLLDRAVSCTKTCLGEVECRTTYPTKDECSTSSECEWEQRCAAPEERCSGFLSQSACVQYGSSFCYWDSSVEKCNVNRRSNPCTRYTSSDSCTFNGCQWQEQCTSAPSTATCDADALDCLYNAHVDTTCDSTCYASCSSYVAGYTFASLLFKASSCLLDCHEECSPAEQPFIFEKQQCVESTDTVTVNVGSQWKATDRVLRAYCHFYDTDGVCGPSGCMTLGWVAPSSRDGFVSVTCELPDVWDILADGAEVKLRVTLYPSIAQNLVSPFCSTYNYALLTKRDTCTQPGSPCSQQTVPRIFDVSPECGIGDSSTVNVSVSIDPTYGEDARATCAFWIRNADGRLSCTWHGCYAAATVDAAGDTIMCTLPPSVPEDVSIFVTVQVWHKDNADKQRNQCFSHEGQSSYLWSDYDYGKFTAKCPVPQCTDEYVPRVYGIDPECDLAQDATTIDVSVAIDPTYGDDARATCAFWLPDATGRLSCTWHGCYAAASVNAAGTVITCTLPDGLPPNEEVHVTVQVWHKDNTANKQRNECFSHEGQSSYSWGGFDFGVFSVNCPGPECTDAYVPRVYGIEPACGLEEGAQTVNVSVAIDPTYGADARATCAF